MAILGEMGNTDGHIDINGDIFYVPQEPWIFPGTIKQNILFGKPYDQQKFNEVIEMCALNRDIKTFQKRENTLIGEKGIDLSDGQCARISLARALYYGADIYLFDDLLSAYDPYIAKYLYNT